MKTIALTQVLDYYDGVEVFAGQDTIGGHYVGMATDEDGNYLVVGVTPEDLRQFRGGQLDLRMLLLKAPGGEWFMTSGIGESGEPFVLQPQDGNIVDCGLLPDEGVLLEDTPVDDFALRQARECGRVVFEFSAEPPETAAEHRIRAETLGSLLIHVQAVVRHAYRAALRDLTTNERVGVPVDGHLLDVVVPATGGSYRMALEAATRPDLFGAGQLSLGLKRLDEVFSSAANPAAAEGILRPHRGHLAGAYLNLVKFLAEQKTGLRYGWADPVGDEVAYGGVSAAAAVQLADSLSRIANLDTVDSEIVGHLFMLNLRRGQWGLETERGKRITGIVDEGGPSLAGLIGDRRYRFHCLEKNEMDVMGRERQTYILQRIEPLQDDSM